MGFLEVERERREVQRYLDALEEECRKIQVFQKELPLCNELVSRTIEVYRQQLFQQGSPAGGDREASSEGPVLEEFLPIKRCAAPSGEQDDRSDDEGGRRVRRRRDEEDGDEITQQQQTKPDWLRSMQLWNPHHDQEPTKQVTAEPKKPCGSGTEMNNKLDALPTAGSSTEDDARLGPDACGRTCCPEIAMDESKNGQKQELGRKTRRCWAPELHNKFVEALEQLGGAHVATPKQIRERMKVDGLTNDEVKSHLQKYRLHTGRPSAPKTTGRNNQLLLVGGTWMPQPPGYAVVDDPVTQLKPLNVNLNYRARDMATGANSDSPTSTSTSSHTITTTTGSPRS